MTITIISHPECLLHDPGFGHPESSKRLQVISQCLAASDLQEKLHYEEASEATIEQLLRVHDEHYIDEIFELSNTKDFVDIDPDTIMNGHTLSAALKAAGAVVQGVDLVLANKTNIVFCNIRPPGHHAERAQAMGFCFFNNVAVGVAHALEHHKLKRVAIIDFDAHRGNGTDDIFQNNNHVLVCSIFEELLYPGDEPPHVSNIINVPLPSGATGREFRAEITQHALEKINAFKPELIFFSAGFDGHQQDMMSNLNLTEADYLWISHQIKSIADEHSKGRIVSALEGGYALSVLGQCVVAHLKGII